MRDAIQSLQNTVLSWAGVTAEQHRFGGTEFKLGGVEIGHVHWNGMVDIPFNSKIRDQLITENRAEPHHILPNTGWITFYMRSDNNRQHAVELFKLSYLFNAMRGQNRDALRDQLNASAELDSLHLSEPLRAIFDSLTRRR